MPCLNVLVSAPLRRVLDQPSDQTQTFARSVLKQLLERTLTRGGGLEDMIVEAEGGIPFMPASIDVVWIFFFYDGAKGQIYQRSWCCFCEGTGKTHNKLQVMMPDLIGIEAAQVAFRSGRI